MKKMIITLVLLSALAAGLQAKILETDTPAFLNQYNKQELYATDNQAAMDYGQNYYRKNSCHQFNIAAGSSLNLDKVNANVKVITWDKNYAEIEIMKTSTLSANDLENMEVLISNNGNLTVSTCCSSPDNCTIINLKIKLPAGVALGEVKKLQGNLSLKKFDHGITLCR
ncbi:MAG: hypothetical protein K9M99_12065 [Candidatus Cloacimonetes bacterium]|nr:hypothetical protein [Candidatus Cloacimonadota bacterium]